MLSLITAIKQSQQLEKRRFSFYIGSNSVLMLLLQSTLNKWLNKTQTLAIRCFTQETPNDERLNAEHLALVDGIENSTVYACGPSGFVSTVEQLLKSTNCTYRSI